MKCPDCGKPSTISAVAYSCNDHHVNEYLTQQSPDTFTVEAGRQIYRNGKPWLYINGVQGHYQPVEADALVHLVVDLLNLGYTFDKKTFKWGFYGR